MKTKRVLKRSYKILYISIIVFLLIISAVLVWGYATQEVVAPAPKPLSGYVLEDGSSMLLGEDYSIGILSAECNKDILVAQAFHYIRKYDALILLGTGENVIESASAIMATYPVANLLVPSKIDKNFLAMIKETHPDTTIQTLRASKELIMGDMVLSSSKSGIVLTHGNDIIMLAASPFTQTEQLSFVIAPAGILPDCSFKSDYLIYAGESADVMQLSMLSDNRYSSTESTVCFFSDGNGLTYVE